MSLVARHLEIPKKIFFYIPKKLSSGQAILEVISKKENVSIGDYYEFIVPSPKGIEKFIGVIKSVNGKTVIVSIKDKAPPQRKFNRLIINRIYIPVGIFIDDFDRTFTGILKDFSLGGFRAQFSKKDFDLFQKLCDDLGIKPIARAVVRFPNLKERYEVDIIPVRFNIDDCSIGFSYTFNTKNENVLKIYEKIVKEQNKQT